MMLSYKISRVAVLPVFIRKTYQIAVTSYLKSLHCKCSSVPVWNSKRLHSEVFQFWEISRGFCNQTSDRGNLSLYQSDVSQGDSLSADTPARPFLDLSKSSAGVSKNMEDVKRKLSVVVNGTEIDMKAVDLYDAIRKMNAHEVLSLVENSFEQLDKTHLCLCLKTLHRWSRRTRNDADHQKSMENIRADKRFQALCILVAEKSRFLEPSIANDMIIFMSHFGYDSSHPVMKHMLQLALHFVSDLALDQLVFLAHCLTIMPVTKQTQVLLEAIKLLNQSRSQHIDMLSTWHKITLVTLFGNDLPYVDELLKSLWHDRDTLATNYSVKVLKALSGITLHHKPLEHWCLEAVCAGVDLLSGADAVTVVESCRCLGLYSAPLFNKLGHLTMSLKEQIKTLSNLADHRWFHGQLMEKVVAGLSNHKLEELDLPPTFVWRMVCLLSDAGAKSDALTENLKSWVTGNAGILQKLLSPAELLNFCLSVSLLGIKPDRSFLELIFSMDFLQHCPSENAAAAVSDITMAEKLILLNGLTNFLAPTDRFMIKVKEMNERSLRPKSLLSGVVSRLWLFAKHGCHTESGLYIDHLLNPEGQKRIAILLWPTMSFWTNTGQMKSVPRLYAKQVQTDGYDMIVVNVNQWKKIPEQERFNYLRCRVNNVQESQDLVMW